MNMGAEDAREKDVENSLRELGSDAGGLSSAEAEKRLASHGPNEIVEKKVNPLLKFLGYFWGPIPWMIEIAVIISGVIGHWEDFGIILALLVLNAVVGFWQEHKADSAIEALKRRLALEARVLRDGEWSQLPARDVVPGDVVRVRGGDLIPADIRLLEGDYLMADESALTGESLPVEKHVGDVGYAGSVVRQGEMTAIVTSTGMNTFFGKTAKMVEEATTRSHFQKAIVKIGNYLIFLATALVMIIFLVGLFRHESLAENLQFALVLTVSAIPVALPAVLSITLALGAAALAKKGAIVSKLVAIEEMAGMDFLCSDKTGTITKNEISVAEAIVFEGFQEEDVLLYGTLASREENKDPIDNAIIKKALASEPLVCSLNDLKVVAFESFDPVSKRAGATVEDASGNRFEVAKGAPQSILSLVADKEAASLKVQESVDAFAARGYRALGVARTDARGDWKLVGLIALYDPPREDSAETIITAEAMDIDVKIVTGDHIAIAKEVSKQTGTGTNIVLPSSFLGKSTIEAQRIVEEVDGFAEVFPEHKYKIVELLQSKDHIVGMTGDGVNDAPALKKADVGIAVAGATDAAKSAAAIVLTRPGLSTIIDAVEESRKIFHRMTNYAIYRIAETIRLIFFITLSIIIFQFYPVTALMIVLLALLNDAPIMTIAFDNVRSSNKPERWDMRSLFGIALMLGIIGVFSSFFIFYIGNDVFCLSREALQSFMYLKLSVAGHLTVFVARTKGPFWSIRPAKSLFLAVVATQVIATLIVVYGFLLPPIGWELALFVWGYALLLFVITDAIKTNLYKLLDHGGIKFRR